MGDKKAHTKDWYNITTEPKMLDSPPTVRITNGIIKPR